MSAAGSSIAGRMEEHTAIRIQVYFILCLGDAVHVLQQAEDTLEAIPKWKEEGVRGLWVKIDLGNSSAVPVCSKLGFDFNHAQSGYVMMTRWLPDTELNKLPEYANQYLGVAGFVVNDKNEVLVIQERFSISSKKIWKLPGGLADKGEDLETTARREVFEETGVDSEFVSVLAFRHQHNFRFGCSDWYFICLMRALSSDIKPCPQEIHACKWMNIDEYYQDPTLTDANRFFVECYKANLSNGGLAIQPTLVNSWNKKYKHNIYRIQPMDKVLDTSYKEGTDKPHRKLRDT